MMTPTELITLLQDGDEIALRGQVITLPDHSLRSDQPLFEHQVEALQLFRNNGGRNGIIHLPTGAGKTRVAIQIMADRLHSDRNERIIWATYPKVLIRQAMLRIAELSYLFPHGTRMLWSEPQNNVRFSNLFEECEITLLIRNDLVNLINDAGDPQIPNEALRDALHGRRPQGCKRVTLIYDECHQLGAAELQRAWRRFSNSNIYEKLNVIGFSATPIPNALERQRLLQERIFPMSDGTTSKKPKWGMLVHESVGNEHLINKKILCPINLSIQKLGVFTIPDMVLRAAGVDRLRIRRGVTLKQQINDFTEQYNNNVLSHERVLEFLATRLAQNLDILGKTLIFVPTIRAANMLTQLLRNDARVGLGKVSVVHSRLNEFNDELDDDDSRAIDVQNQIEEFKRRGHSPCIMINVGMLTTGFDDPKIRTVVLARLTFSTNLFWQMIGRGTRGLECGGTADCIVIDPVKLTDRFEYLGGYRPPLVGTEAYDNEEIDDVGEGAIDPKVPSILETPISASSLPKISPLMRADLRDALVAFLNGGPITKEVREQVTAQMSSDNDGQISTQFIETSLAAHPVQLPPFWTTKYAIDKLESEFKVDSPEVDLTWLRSACQQYDIESHPTILDNVKNRELTTKNKFNAYLISRL
jgi:DNA repair protein RadD